MVERRDIVILSSLDWAELWQVHHELASRLAARGHRVLYVENTGVRAPGWRDRGRILKRMHRWARAILDGGARKVADNLWVVSPLLMPPFGGRWARSINRRVLLPHLTRRAQALGFVDPVVWTYLPTDTARELIARLRGPASTVVYSCLADFAALAPHSEATAASERLLLADCDVVFALPGLVEHCRRHHDQVHTFEPGVSLELFQPSEAPPANRPTRGSRPPVVGYVGGLQRHVDLALLVAAARSRPEWTWVFAGPVYVQAEELSGLPNVRLMGHLAHRALPAVVATFDVGIVPYRLSDYTASVVPTKINEYLAMGKPVVSTGLPWVLELEARSGGAVTTAPAEATAFLSAVGEAHLRSGDPGFGARCRQLAAHHDWSIKVEQMLEQVAAAGSAPPTS